MTRHQAPGGTPAPIAATLNTPPWARAKTLQGRSQAESRSRTADRKARSTPTRTTPHQVSADPDLSAQEGDIITRDNGPACTDPIQPSAPAQAPQQPAPRTGVPAAIARGAAGGAAHEVAAWLTDKLLNHPDWLSGLWHALSCLWQ